MRLGKKFIHHACLLGALVAPAVYLFGSMFMGLAGAHGEELWAQEAGETEYWVEYDGEQYKYIDLSDSYFYYESINNAVGSIALEYTYDRNQIQFLGGDGVYWAIKGNVPILPDTSGAYLYWGYIFDETNLGSFDENEANLEGAPQNICFTAWQDNDVEDSYCYWEIYASKTNGFHYLYWEINKQDNIAYVGNEHLFFEMGYGTKETFGDGSKYEIPTNDFVDFEPNINFNWHSETYNQNYTDGIFGNFFPRQNFLEKWGSDAISANPVGFAPFGQLFRYLDDNMLHFGLNGNQAGLMAYGYMYWIGHVFIADLALSCLVFIPKLLRKIVDKVGGNDD